MRVTITKTLLPLLLIGCVIAGSCVKEHGAKDTKGKGAEKLKSDKAGEKNKGEDTIKKIATEYSPKVLEMFKDCTKLKTEILDTHPDLCKESKLLTASCMEKISGLAEVREDCRKNIPSSVLVKLNAKVWAELSKKPEHFPPLTNHVGAFVERNDWTGNPADALIRHLMKDGKLAKELLEQWKNHPNRIAHLLTDDVIKELPVKLCARVAPSVARYLPETSLSKIIPECFGALQPDLFKNIPPQTWAKVNPEALTALTLEQAQKLAPETFATTTSAQASNWGPQLPVIRKSEGDAKENKDTAAFKEKWNSHPCKVAEAQVKHLKSPDALRQISTHCKLLGSDGTTARPLHLEATLAALTLCIITFMI